MSNDEDLLDAITDWNRAYLSLAKRMILEDHENGARVFGFTDDMATLIGELTFDQIDALSASLELVCQLRGGTTPILATPILASVLH